MRSPGRRGAAFSRPISRASRWWAMVSRSISCARQASKTPTVLLPLPRATTATSWLRRSQSTSSRCPGSSREWSTLSARPFIESWASIPCARRWTAPNRSNLTSWRGSRVYVIVIGGGTVGYFLSRHLLERGHEVTLVEREGSRADWLETQLGSIVMRGDGCEVKFMKQTGIERADAVLAVTAEDEDNLVALQLAKKHF